MTRYMTTITAGVKPANSFAALVSAKMALQINHFHEEGLFTDGTEYWLQKLETAQYQMKKLYPRCRELYISEWKSTDGNFHIGVYNSEKAYQSQSAIFAIQCTDEAVYYTPSVWSVSRMNKACQHLFDFCRREITELHKARGANYLDPDVIYNATIREVLTNAAPFKGCNIGVDYDEISIISVRNNKPSGAEKVFSITFKKNWGNG